MCILFFPMMKISNQKEIKENQTTITQQLIKNINLKIGHFNRTHKQVVAMMLFTSEGNTNAGAGRCLLVKLL